MPGIGLPVPWIAIVVGLAAMALLALAWAAWRRNSWRQEGPIPRFEQVRPLSAPEQVLYWRLVEALPECVVLPQVTFSRFIRPVGTRGRRALQNRISRKTADFLVCLRDFTVVAAVELDDSSHLRERDRQRDGILGSAGVPLVRLRAGDMPSIGRLRQMFTSEGPRPS